MIVVADTSILLYMFDPRCAAPTDSDGNPITNCRERFEALIDSLSKSNSVLVIPTPLAELLTNAGTAGPQWLGAIEGKRAIRIEAFDVRAAVECAAMAAERRNRAPSAMRSKSKFDEQIVAIARVVGATEIYSDDDDIRKLAGNEFEVRGIADLRFPLPPAQSEMFTPPE